MRIRCLVLLIAVGLAGCASRELAPPDPLQFAGVPTTIRIGSWNIEWLGAPESRGGGNRGIARSAVDLADYIQTARVDVLSLQEIAVDARDGSPTNGLLSRVLSDISQRTGGRWSHVLFPAQTGRNQHVGIAWDASRVTAIGDPFLICDPDEESEQGRRIWSRPPFGQFFQVADGLTDFVVVPIHMKSNYGGDFARHRAAEARALVNALGKVTRDGDVIVIGDSNCSEHDEEAITVFGDSGWRDVNSEDSDTHVRYGALDRAFVPSDQPEFVDSTMEVLLDGYLESRGLDRKAFRKRLSDHFLIVTELSVRADDD